MTRQQLIDRVRHLFRALGGKESPERQPVQERRS